MTLPLRDRKSLSKTDAATYIGVSPDTIQLLTRAGKLVPRYLGAKESKPVYLVADLDALVDAAPDVAPKDREKAS